MFGFGAFGVFFGDGDGRGTTPSRVPLVSSGVIAGTNPLRAPGGQSSGRLIGVAVPRGRTFVELLDPEKDRDPRARFMAVAAKVFSINKTQIEELKKKRRASRRLAPKR